MKPFLMLDTKLKLLELAVTACGEGSAPKDIEEMFNKMADIVSSEQPKQDNSPKTPIDHVQV